MTGPCPSRSTEVSPSPVVQARSLRSGRILAAKRLRRTGKSRAFHSCRRLLPRNPTFRTIDRRPHFGKAPRSAGERRGRSPHSPRVDRAEARLDDRITTASDRSRSRKSTLRAMGATADVNPQTIVIEQVTTPGRTASRRAPHGVSPTVKRVHNHTAQKWHNPMQCKGLRDHKESLQSRGDQESGDSPKMRIFCRSVG